MDKYTKDSQAQCNITSSPATRPIINRRLSVWPKMARKPHPAYSEFQGANNEKELYPMGEELIDLILDCEYYHEDDLHFIEELNARNLEAFVYSAVPGSLFHHIPLTRGIKALPTDAVYDGAVSGGTKVYLPKGDTTSGCWLEEVDFENHPILANGIFQDSALGNAISADMPLGRGVMLLSEGRNEIWNSDFLNDGINIYSWTYSGVSDPIDKRDLTGWMGVPAIWLDGTGTTWTSQSFNIGLGTDGDPIALSFGWRTDGDMLVRLQFINGATINVDTTVRKGCGYMQCNQVVPTGMSGGTCRLIFSTTSGNYSALCAPQYVKDKTSYPVYIQSPGGLGAITAQSLKVTGRWQAGMWENYNISNSHICVSGYVMPTSGAYGVHAGGRIFCLEDTNTGDEITCYLHSFGTSLRMYIRVGATLSYVTLTGFSAGDVLFIAFYTGWVNGSIQVGARAQTVSAGTPSSPFTVEDTTTAGMITSFDTLWVGCSENEDYQADCVFQDVNIWAGTEDMINTMVTYMTLPDHIRTVHDTQGRLYKIFPNLSPHPHNAQRYTGELYCVNTKVL